MTSANSSSKAIAWSSLKSERHAAEDERRPPTAIHATYFQGTSSRLPKR